MLIVLVTFLSAPALGFDWTTDAIDLNSDQRLKLTQELSALSAMKSSVGYNFPLGGFPGIELGLSYDSVAFSATEGSQSLIKFQMAKGLYNNVDILFDFSPFSPDLGYTHYAGGARWRAYESGLIESLHAVLISGLFLQTSGTTFRETVYVSSFSAEVYTSLIFQRGSLNASYGRLFSDGRFREVQGEASEGIDLSAQAFQVGGSLEVLPKFFVSASASLLPSPIYAVQLSVRFD